MIKSSIVVPRSASSGSAQKRAVDQDSPSKEEHSPVEKRPRHEMTDANKQRGRRLFGVVLGTLSKFKDENEKSEVSKKRQEIDAKLQEKLASEKKELSEKVQAERQRKEEEAAAQRKEAQRLLDEKREVAAIRQKEGLANYIKTTTEPSLYYLPAKLTDDAQKLLEDQRDEARQRRQSFEERRESRTAKDDSVSRRDHAESSPTRDSDPL